MPPLYDGASALAEAVIDGCEDERRRPGAAAAQPAPLLPACRRDVCARYRVGNWRKSPGTEAGTIDLERVESELNDDTAAVVVQNPNFVGVLEPLEALGSLLQNRKTAYVAAVNPISLGVIRPPGDFGADIVVGDGQPLGLPLSYGGPYVGDVRHAGPAYSTNARAGGRSDDRRGREAGVRYDASDARTAYSPGTGDLEYLHESDTVRDSRDRLSCIAGSGWPAGSGNVELEPQSRSRVRSERCRWAIPEVSPVRRSTSL